MPSVPEDVQAAIELALKPSLNEVTRGKNAILRLLNEADEPKNIGELQAVLLASDGLPMPREAQGKIDVEAVDEESLRLLEVVAVNRLARAASEAVISLEAEGILLPVQTLPGESPRPIIGDTITIDAFRRNHQFGARVATLLPGFPTAYRLAPRFEGELPWYVDADIFLLDLQDLSLEPRTRRALDEALQAYRHRLYLAAANLLGAVSEGAWYSAAVQLTPFDQDLHDLLGADRPAALTIRRQTADLLRTNRRLKSEVDGLVAQAETLRLLRNYAVHPTDEETEHLERYLGEVATGTLILNSHSYLTRLMTLTAEWITDATR